MKTVVITRSTVAGELDIPITNAAGWALLSIINNFDVKITNTLTVSILRGGSSILIFKDTPSADAKATVYHLPSSIGVVCGDVLQIRNSVTSTGGETPEPIESSFSVTLGE